MSPDAAVIVSDAHLGHAPAQVAEAFHEFLAAVPDLGRHLVINGDLFDFWFEYRAVIPRRAFPTLAALDRVRRAGVKITLTGGNHDRWGGEFWRRELEADFHAEGTVLNLAGKRAYVTHGDGIAERHVAARVMHRVTRWPLTAALFRWVHPDLGLRLVDRMSGSLADRTRDPTVISAAAAAQSEFARGYLRSHADVDVVVLGHTHRAAIEEVDSGRWYLNPGSWMDGRSYALVGAAAPSLERFEASLSGKRHA